MRARVTLRVAAISTLTLLILPILAEVIGGTLIAEGAVPGILAWIASFAGTNWYWYAVVAALAFCIGAGVDWLIRRVDGSRDARLASVAADLRNTSARLIELRERIDREVHPGDTPAAIESWAMDYRAALKSAEGLGLLVPWIDYEEDPVGYLDVCMKYVSRVAPLLERGHLHEAKLVSAKQTEAAKRLAAIRPRL